MMRGITQTIRIGAMASSLFVVSGVAAAQQVTWDTVKTHPEMYLPGGTPEGECVGLVVSNHGEMGHCGLGGVNMDFCESGLECGTRPEDCIYLFSGSPFLLEANETGDTVRLTCSCGRLDASSPCAWRPVPDLGEMRGGVSILGDYDSLFTGRFVNRDTTIGMDRTFYTSREIGSYTNIIVVQSRLYSLDGSSHNNLTVGSVVDWNIPSDSFNESDTQTWQGYVYQVGCDTIGSEACQPNTARFGVDVANGWRPHYIEECFESLPWGAFAYPQALLRDTNWTRHGEPLDPPQPDGRAWLEEIGNHPAANPWAGSGDLATWSTFVRNYDLAAADTLYMYSVLVTVRNGSVFELEGSVYYARGWLSTGHPICCIPEGCGPYGPECCQGKVGDANKQGGDDPTIADISVMIDALFISRSPGHLACLREADVNQSHYPGWIRFADITIGDIAALVDALFITADLNVLPECQ